jgi:outer membrane beta-barrel protein
MKNITQLLSALAGLSCASLATAQKPDDSLFRDVEVRVIRQKFFQKTNRIEMNGNLAALTNRSFVYTAFATGQAGFHINEQIGLFGEGGIGVTQNKSDCEILGEKFLIEPVVDDLKNWFGGGIAYTPVYGKYQLASGEVIYFDWFFSAGSGLAGIGKRKGTCIPNSTAESKQTMELQLSIGTGQRYFITKNTAANWNIKYMLVQDPLGGSIVGGISNVLMSVGISQFL